MNPVIMPIRTGLRMTRSAIHSISGQDIPTHLILIDNGSDCGNYLRSLPGATLLTYREPRNLHLVWNMALEMAFEQGADHALVVNNDIVMGPWTYRVLLEDGGSFVTGVGSNLILHPQPVHLTRSPHPDFSCFLIRRECYEKVGPFDERFFVYCGDNDYHLRMHAAGIEAISLNLPFYHERSSTIKCLPEDEAEAIRKIADLDRDRFREKWGFEVWSPTYNEQFSHGPENISNSPDLR